MRRFDDTIIDTNWAVANALYEALCSADPDKVRDLEVALLRVFAHGEISEAYRRTRPLSAAMVDAVFEASAQATS